MNMQVRTKAIIDVVGDYPLSPRQIANVYMNMNPTNSDVLSTCTICNILTAACILKKSIVKAGKANRTFYRRYYK